MFKLVTKAFLTPFLFALTFAFPAHAVVMTATANLSGDNERPPIGPVDTEAFGSATLMIDTVADTFTFSLDVNGIGIADITFADPPLAFGELGPTHIHDGDFDENGPIVLPFPDMADFTATTDGFSLNASGTLSTSLIGGFTVQQFVDNLANEGLYVNVHTQFSGGGEIRGQLIPVPAPAALGLFGLGLAGLGLGRIGRLKAAA